MKNVKKISLAALGIMGITVLGTIAVGYYTVISAVKGIQEIKLEDEDLLDG